MVNQTGKLKLFFYPQNVSNTLLGHCDEVSWPLEPSETSFKPPRAHSSFPVNLEPLKTKNFSKLIFKL